MMIYILFIVLMSLFVLSYFFAGRDFFAPATVQVLTFAGAVFMCIYFMWVMDCPHDFQVGTIALVIAVLAFSTVIGIIVHRTFSKVKIKSNSSEDVGISPIYNMVSYVVIAIVIITIFWMLMEIRRIGGPTGSFYAMMHRFRSLNSYSTMEEAQFPWVLRQLAAQMKTFIVLYAFNLIYFFKELPFLGKIVNIFIIILCFMSQFLLGARTPVVHMILTCSIMFHLFRIKRQGGYKPYSLKKICQFVLIIALVMSTFFITRDFVGRQGTRNYSMSPDAYVAYYVGSGFIALDDYLQHPVPTDGILGKYTFRQLLSFLRDYLGVNIPHYIAHLEFRPVGAGFTNNVYTFLRIYHHDFGVIGLFVLLGFSMAFLSLLYEYVKRKRSNVGILTFSMMYYSVVMSFFTERFYSDIFSVNFLKLLLVLLLLYEVLIRKRPRLSLADGDVRRLFIFKFTRRT